MADKLFSKKHIWIEPNGNNFKIGITKYAQEQLGNIMFLNLPDPGERVEIGNRFGDIESIKTVSDLISPVTGIVVKVNEALLDDLDSINENSWFAEIKVTSTSDELMTEDMYLERKESF